jgi:predicted ribosome quality control (RQC) complex YloA/Tae2 family protein
LSLNWREIDRVLAELPLEGAFVRQVYQPSHPVLVLELYRQGANFRLLFCFATPQLRLHSSSAKPANPSPAPRFASFLRSRLRDGRILSAAQLGRERIVRLEVARGEDRLLLWARLWGGAANLIVTDLDGRILDALYRRPKRGEVSGGQFQPPAGAAPSSPAAAGGSAGPAAGADRFQAREFPGEGTYNERVERHYAGLERDQGRERLLASARSRLERRENRILAGLETLRQRRESHGEPSQLRRCGELILANVHAVEPGARWLSAEDYEAPGRPLRIELDPRLGPAQNAESYFRRYRKATAGLARLGEDIGALERELEAVRRERQSLESAEDPAVLAALAEREAAEGKRERPIAKRGTGAKAGRERTGPQTPGLAFASGPFRLLVGRSAAENDALLRRHVRGNDTWVHARDAPGAYVFIRSLPGKSVPLEALLDAANLALHYSKARGSGKGDVYYTQVKYLRRARDGAPGLVLPTQEKNLHVRLDPQRLARLLGEY